MSLLLALLALAYCKTLAPQALADGTAPPDATPAKARLSVVQIRVTNGQGSLLASCSGFVLGNGMIVTEFSPVQGGSELRVRSNEGIEYPIDGILAVDQALDLALVRAQSVYVPPLEIREWPLPQVGDRVFALSAGGGAESVASESTIGSFRDVEGWGSVMRMAGTLTPEYSGGPLLDCEGRVVGVVHVMSFSGIYTAVAIPAARLGELVRQATSELVPLTSGKAPALPVMGLPDDVRLGQTPPKSFCHQVSIPREGIWRSPYGAFLLPDTVRVTDDKGTLYAQVYRDPRKGEFRCRHDGVLRFSTDDAHQSVSVSYMYQGRKVAVLPSYASAHYADAAPVLEQVLSEELAEHGFEVVRSDDVADALVAVKKLATGAANASPVYWLPLLAERLDAAYLILPAVDANQELVLAGFQSFHSTRSSVTVTGSAISATSKLRGFTLPVVRDTMEVAVGIKVYDGATGCVLSEQTESGSKRVVLRQFKPARQELIADLAPDLVRQWLESPL